MVAKQTVARLSLAVGLLTLGFSVLMPGLTAYADTDQLSQSVGVEGTIAGPAPTQAPSIGVPTNGQNFTNIPISVSGLCQSGLLVEIFKTGVFAGSTECVNSSYSLQVDLFSGRNDLIARQYDALNQSSPDSQTVTVNFNDNLTPGVSQVTITSQYSKRGANPGDELTWPLSINGGTGPYAVSVDWGDKTTAELLSLNGAGNFNINHVYQQAGTYNVTVKATDLEGNSAFLQIVGVGNGAIQQSGLPTASTSKSTSPQKVIVWWPYIVLFILSITTFWLGKQHQLETIRSRLRRGERPFK